MHELVTALSVVNSVIFGVLAVVAVRRWRRKRDGAAGWLALSFLALGLILTFGRLLPEHPHGFVLGALLRF